jgi:hypothetical protein
MPNPEIEEFAKILVQQVRDAAIRSSDRALRAQAVDPVAKRWKEAAHAGDAESFAKVIIPDVVDDTVFQLLRALDQGLLKLSFTASNGKKLDLTADGLGELGGWYAGIPGWRSTFSKERFIDDYSDLR